MQNLLSIHGIQLVFYIISIVLIIKAVIRVNFAVPTSSKVYKTCILFTAIIAIIQILKFQGQYTNYLEEIELFNSIGVAVCFTLSIIYYFVYREDKYCMNVLRMDKEVAVSILEDVKQSLYNENAKQKGLSTINQYICGLKITQNEKIQQLINKQKEYCKLYGENDKRTVKLNRKVDEELKKIFSS